MKNTFLVLGAIAVFVTGLFSGAKIIDSNQSIYAQIKFDDYGHLILGKQLDLTNPASFDESDKALLISGIKKLQPIDEISVSILELQERGSGLFAPRQYSIKLHITNDTLLQNSVAAVCDIGASEFYRKTILIFDNRESSTTNNMITVGAWNARSSGHCIERSINHVWIGTDAARLLFSDSASEFQAGSEVDLLARVSATCQHPNQVGEI